MVSAMLEVGLVRGRSRIVSECRGRASKAQSELLEDFLLDKTIVISRQHAADDHEACPRWAGLGFMLSFSMAVTCTIGVPALATMSGFPSHAVLTIAALTSLDRCVLLRAR